MIQVGEIVEVTGANHARKGVEGIVDLIEGSTVWVVPTNLETLRPTGEAFPININLLIWLPNKLDILRGQIKGREANHNRLGHGNTQRAGHIRHYQTRMSRKMPPG